MISDEMDHFILATFKKKLSLEKIEQLASV